MKTLVLAQIPIPHTKERRSRRASVADSTFLRARNLRRSYITKGFVFIGQLLNQPLQGSPLRERGLTASPYRSAPIGSHINSDSEMIEIPRFFNVSD